MSERKHTPGPWMVEGRTVYALNDDGYNRFSALVQDAHTPGDELEANAQLIAAAPDLLEAIEICLKAEYARHEKLLPGAPATTYTQARIDKIEAAIAKATGESK